VLLLNMLTVLRLLLHEKQTVGQLKLIAATTLGTFTFLDGLAKILSKLVRGLHKH